MGSFSGADETSLQRLIDQHNGNFAPGKVHEITSEEDLKKIRSKGKLVVIDWYAHWCGPCKAFKPTFQKMAEEQTDILFCKIDVDENKELATQYAIRSMPTFKASVRAIIRIVKTNVFSCCEGVPLWLTFKTCLL